jgi:hypothetical protein
MSISGVIKVTRALYVQTVSSSTHEEASIEKHRAQGVQMASQYGFG